MKNKTIILIIFLVGLILRIYPALKQPLWLDEIYSLYFAHSFSIKNLLVNLPETHPGGFYILLKFFLRFTTNIFFLRITLSVLPELIGCWLIYKIHPKIIPITLFLLNPFFIHYSWQLRMYGVTFLLTVLLYRVFFIKHPKFNFQTISLIFISLFVSLDLIIPILCLSLYALVKSNQKRWLSLFLLVPLTFLLQKGLFTYKSYTELASWISPPTFTNIPSVLLTSFGFHTDINNLDSFPIATSLIFYLVFSFFTYKYAKKSASFFYGFFLPLLTTITISFLFPILSQRFFFYHFIPKVSLMLPRFMLPLSIFFFIELNQHLTRKTTVLLILPIIVFFWINPNIKLNYETYYNSSRPLPHQENALILPPWENLRLNPSFTSKDLDTISNNYNFSLTIEKYIVDFNSHPDCQPFKNLPTLSTLTNRSPVYTTTNNIPNK
jgi:hypothetical protein